ncbi:YqjF family protein [Schumannella luteola]
MIDRISADPPVLPGRVVAGQEWRDVSFLHWRTDPDAVAPLLPAGCRPDVWDGSTWVGLIGFHLGRATLGPSPAIPYLGSFAEINVRLYAIDGSGRRGVVFLSLEASRLAAVLAARAVFSIPYFWSSTRLERAEDVIEYRSRRHLGSGASTFAVRPGAVIRPTPLDDFLTSRWGLFTRRLGRTVFLPNTHEKWVLRSAELLSLDDSLLAAAGVPVEGPPESVLYSPGVRARFGPARPVPNR